MAHSNSVQINKTLSTKQKKRTNDITIRQVRTSLSSDWLDAGGPHLLHFTESTEVFLRADVFTAGICTNY